MDAKEDELVPDYIGRVISEIGPSIFITTLAEITCFFIGSLSDMPVVRSFALYAAMALVFNFLLQMSCFISLLALDAKRVSIPTTYLVIIYRSQSTYTDMCLLFC